MIRIAVFRASAILAGLALLVSACSTPPSTVPRSQPSARDAVLGLQQAIAAHDWASASNFFSPELRAQRKGDPHAEGYWQTDADFILPGTRKVWTPLGPEDTVLDERVSASGTEVLIEHKNRMDKDARPRVLILNKGEGEWRVTDTRNY